MRAPFENDAIVSACYQGLFEEVTDIDFWIQDWMIVEETWAFYDLLIWYPSNILKHTENVYEQCGGYQYLVMLSLIFGFDYGFLAELVTRISLIVTDEAQAFLADMYYLFAAPYTDWYLVGVRIGIFWKKLFDVELTPE